MKAIRVAVIMVMVGLLGGELLALGERKVTVVTEQDESTPVKTPARRVSAQVSRPASGAVRPLAAKRSSVQQSRAVVTKPTTARKQAAVPAKRVPAAKPVVVKAPAEVDIFVWDTLSDDQKSTFNQLNTGFKRTIANFAKSKKYNLWRDAIVDQAKAILDINILLKDYCIEVISDELEKNAESKGIDAEQQIAEITQEFDTYIPEYMLVSGTEKEQFERLMGHIPFDRSGKPTDQWLSNVLTRAINLVNSNTLSLQDMKRLLTKGFEKKLGKPVTKGSNAEKSVDNIVNKVSERVNKMRLESSSEYVNARYQNLLLTLGDATNWDMHANKPQQEWTKNIIAASKNMIKLFGMSLNDIEQQIGAQVFFVATMNNRGQQLAPAKQTELVDLVTSIKQQIGQ